jgi:hypothetical protein
MIIWPLICSSLWIKLKLSQRSVVKSNTNLIRWRPQVMENFLNYFHWLVAIKLTRKQLVLQLLVLVTAAGITVCSSVLTILWTWNWNIRMLMMSPWKVTNLLLEHSLMNSDELSLLSNQSEICYFVQCQWWESSILVFSSARCSKLCISEC